MYNDDDWIWDDEPVNSGNGSSGDVSEEIGNTTVIRSYDWNERNQMVRSINGSTEAWYVYGADGQRTNKYTSSSETVYFSRFWAWRGESAFTPQNIKNIYLGESRLVTKINSETGHDSYSEELHKTYYYHSDHLGSAQLITDWQGMEYQRIEYTPYGETWVEKTENTYDYLPYKFTGKELDDETGLYYYGARYLDAKFSLWTSTDPALGEYLPKAGADNSNLPGMGGVFNTTNSHLYNYCSNNPVRYIDPDGMKIYELTDEQWSVVNASLEEAISNLKLLIDQLSDFSTEGDGKLMEAAKLYLGRDFSIVEDYAYLKVQCKSLIDCLSKMDRSNFKYDDFNNDSDEAETFAWCYFAIGKTMYLGKSFFEAGNKGNDTKTGVLIHEATHLCGFAIDVPPNPYGIKNARKKLLKNLNSDNYEYFYEYIFKGGK